MNAYDRLDTLTIAEKAALTSGASLWRTKAIESAQIPSILMTDGPHGVRKQREDPGAGIFDSVPATCFPPAVCLGSTWDQELVRRVGRALGEESRAQGLAVLLGPGINIKRTPLGGRNFEYYSEDPVLAGVLATAWVQGLQSQGVGASLKHFAVNSQETDRMRISADVDERSLREVYLWAFQRVVQRAQPWTVMCSYNRINGVYASQYRWLLTDVLRGEWGFTGLVVSDWGAVVDRVAAIHAGLDLAMPGPDERGDALVADAIAEGSLDSGDLDTAAGRVLTLVDRATAADSGAAVETFDVDAHHALAREVAARGVVLLKNEGGLLPLEPAAGSLAVIGELSRTPRYQGGGSSQINPTRLDNALEEINALACRPVGFAAGYELSGEPDAGLLSEAVDLARGSDVAIVFAGTVQETEGADRDGIDLPANQVELIERVAEANPRTVVVLSNGAVLRTGPWDWSVPALIEGWLLGQAGGGAIADVLFGRVNPSGRLAETIPSRIEDHPSYLDFPGEAGHVRYGEGIHVGYRWFDARDIEVAYPFGFGLSYTTFEYGAATATASDTGIEVRVPVTNTGTRDGREVVQVYVSVPGSRVRRAPRELKGFANVEISAGATVTAMVAIPREDLAYWDVALDRWVVEDGGYQLHVGASSRDIRSTVTVCVTGDDVRAPLTAESTIREWLEDPRGAKLLGQLVAEARTVAAPSLLSAALTDPQSLLLVGPNPLGRLVPWSGGLLTHEMVEQLVAAVNA